MDITLIVNILFVLTNLYYLYKKSKLHIVNYSSGGSFTLFFYKAM